MGEELHKCRRCGELKPASAFHWQKRRGGERDYMCRPCRSAYHREHYLANKQKYIEQAARSKRKLHEERTRYLLAYFEEHPCTDCGETDPLVLEFDHLSDKEFGIGQGLHNRSWSAILREIDKCEVVCRNCHHRRELRRRRAMRFLLTEADLRLF